MKKILFTLLACLSLQFSQGQSYQLHTVYIYSFTRYVQWPVETGEFIIGVVGDSPITDHLVKMSAAKKVGARKIKIVQFDKVADVTASDIIFLSDTESSDAADLIAKLEGESTLLITESPGLALEGSAINFVIKNGKLAFELNKSAIDNAGLKVSTELSRLAIII